MQRDEHHSLKCAQRRTVVINPGACNRTLPSVQHECCKHIGRDVITNRTLALASRDTNLDFLAPSLEQTAKLATNRLAVVRHFDRKIADKATAFVASLTGERVQAREIALKLNNSLIIALPKIRKRLDATLPILLQRFDA